MHVTTTLSVDRGHFHQGCRVITSRQLNFNHQVPRSSWYPFDQCHKDERLCQRQSHLLVLNLSLWILRKLTLYCFWKNRKNMNVLTNSQYAIWWFAQKKILPETKNLNFHSHINLFFLSVFSFELSLILGSVTRWHNFHLELTAFPLPFSLFYIPLPQGHPSPCSADIF